jgi:hypothetical protein
VIPYFFFKWFQVIPPMVKTYKLLNIKILFLYYRKAVSFIIYIFPFSVSAIGGTPAVPTLRRHGQECIDGGFLQRVHLRIRNLDTILSIFRI